MTYFAELARTVERLRQLSEARLTGQEQTFLGLLSSMTSRRVPRVAPRAWADQLTVIGREVPLEDQPALATGLIEFRRRFDLLP